MLLLPAYHINREYASKQSIHPTFRFLEDALVNFIEDEPLPKDQA